MNFNLLASSVKEETLASVGSYLNIERLQGSFQKFTWKNLLSPEKKIKTFFLGWGLELGYGLEQTHYGHAGYNIKAESDGSEMCNPEWVGRRQDM